MLEINLHSIMALTRALVPQMKARRWGRIIHISSIMGLVSKEGRNAYSATKAALIGMALASALDLGAYGITVNCIAPGPILDRPARRHAQRRAEEAIRRPDRPGPLGRAAANWSARPCCWPATPAATSPAAAGRRRRHADQDVLGRLEALSFETRL